MVQIYSSRSNQILRTLSRFKEVAHSGSFRPVNVTKFLSDNLRVMSGSNDKTVRVWDIATEKELSIYNEHQQNFMFDSADD
nr:hypothetical protein BaRGS_023033 [Batillaria attramentaria]